MWNKLRTLCIMAFVPCIFHPASATELRISEGTHGRGRMLKDISSTVTSSATTFNLTVTSPPGGTYSSCLIAGYPGSSSNAVEGPLVLSVPRSVSTVRILFAPGTVGGSAVALFDNTTNVATADSIDTGLTSVVWTRDSTPSSFGFVTGGLIKPFNPALATGSISATPVCFLNVTFTTEGVAPGPASSRFLVDAPTTAPPFTESNGTTATPAIKAAQPTAQIGFLAGISGSGPATAINTPTRAVAPAPRTTG